MHFSGYLVKHCQITTSITAQLLDDYYALLKFQAITQHLDGRSCLVAEASMLRLTKAQSSL